MFQRQTRDLQWGVQFLKLVARLLIYLAPERAVSDSVLADDDAWPPKFLRRRSRLSEELAGVVTNCSIERKAMPSLEF